MVEKKNKKAAEMTIGTVVVIILALVVLIFLIYGFSSGWNNIWQKILNIGGGEANVATVIQACQFACSSNNLYDYCRLRDIKFGSNPENTYGIDVDAKTGAGSVTCKELEAKGVPGAEKCTNILACESCKAAAGVSAPCAAYNTNQANCEKYKCTFKPADDKTKTASSCIEGNIDCTKLVDKTVCLSITTNNKNICEWKG